MHIVVCIKEVPKGHVSMNPDTGHLIRDSKENEINPYDLSAIEIAVQIKEKMKAHLTAITMGPEHAKQVLHTAISMGADEAILFTDGRFAGADAYATGYTLSQGIQILKPVDLIICGQQTTDGDTSQVPFSLAAQSGYPCVGFVKSIHEITNRDIEILQEITGGTARHRVTFPCVLSMTMDCATPRIPTMVQRMKAKRSEVQIKNLEDLQDTNPLHYGIQASPTRVRGIEVPMLHRKKEVIETTPEKALEMVKKEITCLY
ncbi:electron transfer flavoprotein subunit beta/FixA family protein [Clostridium sp. CS001]|uniref:electron transfer flavoprotein subunit beta/FixA family protein n=1 Tax=Clostridium sp. CS001 TaxID=2880648 RepID=UPI001CF3AAC0|nr:electron transfer flavoprotein subunit beta/FixA family protein [Clostridium sp. CS001]MCB2289853.1 electron transfer flavoprotein subunit beta/FixA family protein [Clostridium sp. CS001]